MGIRRNVFQMVSISRKPKVTENFPKKGTLSVNVVLAGSPELANFEGKEVMLVASAVNITLVNGFEVIMKSESLYDFENSSEESEAKTSIQKRTLTYSN